MIKVDHIAFLLYKELEGSLSEAESRELESWRTENPEHTEFFEEVIHEDGFAGIAKLHHPENKEVVRESILAKMDVQFKVVSLYRRPFFRVAVAACIAALILAGGYFMFFNKQDESKPPIAKTNEVEAPKTNKAVIELPDGKLISLDTLTTYTQGSVTVTKTADGRLVYTGFGSEVKFNTLTNPRGSKVIDIELADKSHVWLNAGSSITYPVAFMGKERTVSMKGEAYFKVAHNTSMPFTVRKGNMEVTVLGTEFNVNAYDDEPNIKVTLLEGSVKVDKASSSAVLKPGQQAQIESQIKVLSNVDIDAVMAWKNGFFQFNRSSVQDVMRQVARWYDVDVAYEGKIPEREFGGKINRNASMSQVLKILEESNVHVKIEGRKITVLP